MTQTSRSLTPRYRPRPQRQSGIVFRLSGLGALFGLVAFCAACSSDIEGTANSDPGAGGAATDGIGGTGDPGIGGTGDPGVGGTGNPGVGGTGDPGVGGTGNPGVGGTGNPGIGGTGDPGVGGTGAGGTDNGGIGGTGAGGTNTGGGESGGGTGNGETSELDGLPETTCDVSILSGNTSTDMPTVGVVTFSTTLSPVSKAEIQFGPDTGYGLIAPVNLSAASYRTLLLGMTTNSTYHYRVAVSDGTNVCYGPDQEVTTGGLRSGVNALGSASTGAGAANGFIITSAGNNVIIFNKAGDIVWGYNFPGQIFSAKISWDGQYMFGRDVGPFDAATGGTIHRVAMDGSGVTSFDVTGGDHHDLTAVPGGFAYLAKNVQGECDRIFTVDNNGQNRQEVVDLWDVYSHFGGGGGEKCHCNRLHYSSDLDMYTVSDREKDTLAFISSSGEVVTSVGKAPQDNWSTHILAAGAGSQWRVQHGHHFYADDKLLIFTNNGSAGSGLIHYTISGSNATVDWTYTAAGNSGTQGDAQALPNGNFLVTASNAGVIHEISPSRVLIGSYAVGGGGGGGGFGGGGFGYTEHRPTLYGPPAGR